MRLLKCLIVEQKRISLRTDCLYVDVYAQEVCLILLSPSKVR